MKKLAFLFLAFSLASVTFLSRSATAQVSLQSGLYNPGIQVFFLNDFDLARLGNSPPIFWIRMQNDNHPRDVILKFAIRSQNYGILAEGQTKPFHLDPNELRQIDNRDLFSGAGSYSLDSYDIRDDIVNDLKNDILATGKLPTDTYTIDLSVHDVVNNQPAPTPLDQTELSLEITNPTTLDLVAPGTNATSADLPVIFTTLPLLQWSSTASHFRVTVCEKLPTNTSPQDVMDNEPRLETQVSDQTSLQYPSVGAWPLEPGKTYYWQVVAIVQTSGGPVELESEIWGFTIGDLGTSGTSSAQQIQILGYLRAILGDDVVDALLGEGGQLANHRATGVILKNGSRLSDEELRTLIERFRLGQIQLISFSVE